MKKILSIVAVLVQLNLYAQESLAVTEEAPVSVNGLKAGYSIASETEKEVGSKGNFSRFQVEFYVTNTGNEAKILLHKQGFTILGSGISPNLAQFKCSNATGARMTSKELTLQAKQCIVEGLVEETDPSNNKTAQNKRLVNIGYWIKPGETISSKTVVIVPLNEKPNITVTFFPGTNNMIGSAINTNELYNNNNNQNITQEFVHLKNFGNNDYLHNQNGPLACSSIDYGWWSAQWEILPVNGTNYFNIRNRWKNSFLSTDNSSLLSNDGQSARSMWIVEETGTSNVFYIKNSSDNSKLLFQNGMLKVFGSYNNNDTEAQWVIEK